MAIAPLVTLAQVQESLAFLLPLQLVPLPALPAPSQVAMEFSLNQHLHRLLCKLQSGLNHYR